MRGAAVTGGRIGGTAYAVHGEGPPLVLVHGLGLNRLMWQWQWDDLSRHFTVVGYDLLGHGESGDPPVPCRLGHFSAQLLELLDGLGIERCALVGFSLGGMIVRDFAITSPERVSALAILNSAHARSAAQREAVLARVRHAREAGPAATVEAAIERWFTDRFRAQRPEVLELVREWVRANDPKVYAAIYRVLAQGDIELTASIAAIRCPTLVLTGGEDHGNSPEMALQMAALIPGARVEIVPGLRHMGLVETPDAVNDILIAFLEEALNDRREGDG